MVVFDKGTSASRGINGLLYMHRESDLTDIGNLMFAFHKGGISEV